ncbi:hypothetical protein FSP39_010737 [Pinctada imbricata]|uniref:Macro domain-containing protein n=1 Tax=Pinctada imbricata TaxID=66713 RepID=A0AA89C9X4_PINIB|nr:hypothetical protein FSP39_010737 [Pinctada imbricata]
MTYRQVCGDLLHMTDVDAICHQVNCLTVKSHGLSRRIAEQFPWADIYSFRKPLGRRNLATMETRGTPGTIQTFEGETVPKVICLLSQWDYGKCGQSNRRISPYTDSKENRTLWFEQCLTLLGQTNFKYIAFPFKIGCGLAGGDWTTYRQLIKEFVKKYNKNAIVVVPLS